MRALPSLGLVAINGVGFDKVDLLLARERGIAVTNTPDVLTEDVADLAIGLIIALLRQIPRADRFVRDGSWGTAEWPLGRKVTGSRFGVLGLGRIGQAIADRLAPFGEVAYCGRSEKPGGLRYFARPRELAEWCDVLVVACAASAQTANLVDAEVIAALGERGWLVNVARGSVIDERALAAAIADGRLAGAALDVFAAEPVVPDALMRSERTVLTPHIASGTHETRGAMAELVLGNIDAFLAGKPLRTRVA
jgi:lactate dehydrogenase-like 2-hydroxyacid dehydrogenase